jgi:hypothetical protein
MSLSANLLRQRTLQQNWYRNQSRCQILRSQLGFNHVTSERPLVCIGCLHYHGKAYGQTRGTRTPLICGSHPYGWTEDDTCPDWQGTRIQNSQY